MNKLIINADDFGMNREVNVAIMTAMELNICTDTTLLVNFEDSEQAAGLAISNKRINNVGIHFNLTEGQPISNKIRKESRFCNSEGVFHFKKTTRIMLLSKSERIAVYEEMKSQLKLCRSFGIPVSHADSHNHIHEEPGLFQLFIQILKQEKIPFLRITNNLGKTSLINKFYRHSYNAILNYNKLSGTDYFGSIANLTAYRKMIPDNSIVEIMIHPGRIVNDEIYDVYSKENISLKLPGLIKGNTLISYHQLVK